MRSPRELSVSLEDVLRHARLIVAELDRAMPESDSELFSAKLARAHALGLVDQLEETLYGRFSSAPEPRADATQLSH